MDEDQLRVLNSVQEVEELIVVAFGPEGRAVLVQQPNGKLSITRSGFSIVSSVFSETNSKQPTQRILLDCARKLNDSLGDGVKSFILLVSALLKYSVVLNNPVHVTRQLTSLQVALNSFHSQTSELPEDENVLKQKTNCFRSIVYTFFSTRFSPSVYNILASSLCEWISLQSHSYSYKSLQDLLQQFSYLCQYEHGGARAVNESCVEPGYRVNRSAFNLFGGDLRRVTFLMLGDRNASNSGCFDEMDVQAEVDKFILELKSNSVVEYDSNCEKVLIITSAILSDLLLFRLKCSDVAVLQGVLPEEISFIYSALFKTEHRNDPVINVRILVECGETYTWLGIPNVHQLLLKAPTAELAAEYACACLSAVKVCVVAAQVATSEGIPCIVKAGGQFERDFQAELLKKGGKNLDDPFLCGVTNRAELLAWNKQRIDSLSGQNSKKLLQSIACSINNIALNSENIPQNDLSSGCSDRSSCVYNVSTYLYKDLDDALKDIDTDILSAVVKALQAVARRLPQSSPVKESLYDPIGLKVSILQHSLGAAVNLLRISGIIKTKTKLPF